ncbi:O-glycosyl hydrolase [Catenuloplanes nepalensis]|uniref:O-glycosyl hydrolase n=1 Tax=Catenuloplanes nepalensis TaxID=587533 RepID=A0ABT9MLX4_9ACTN|nr:glycoside hydrolase [Catenuloplanes nepalensis]MDP9792331.1 O-glycosyl hydrolase [Catenuloplanes nepalensis]
MTARHRFLPPLAATVAAVLSTTALAVPPAHAGAAAIQNPAWTISVDPSYQQEEFQGWGTSLVWMAHATGGYPDEIRERLVDLVFGADGLNLNIARYNIGGGNAPTVEPYLRPGGAVPGWWRAPSALGPQDREWWDPQNPGHWDWDADPNQRWWVDQVKDEVDTWEAFSNSPPWFQTVSGYVSGGFDASQDQIRADKADEFAEYLVRVTEHLESAHGIAFDTIDPLNEPNTNYWGTTLGPDGQPTGGRQEGAHAGPALQATVIEALAGRLATARTRARVSAPDETNPGTFVTDWYGLTPAARDAVTQLNVHTYGTGQRTAARDVAKAEQRPLWMSEVEGSWGNDYTSMNSGLGMAQRIIDDLRELEPTAWVLWQPIEDMDNMVAEGNLQWGSIHVPFDCTAADTLATCPIRTNTKFDTIRNFTHFIRPGDHMVKVGDTASAAAITADGRGATVVHANGTATARDVTLDLTRFGTTAADATVTPVVTSASGKLVRGGAVRVAAGRATLTVPAESVTTFLVTGVSGVAGSHVTPGHTYRLEGVQSGRSLSADATIRTGDPARADQLWTLTGDSVSNRARYTVTNAGTGRRLAVRGGTVLTEAPAGAADDGALWTLSTTGDGTYTLINVAARRVLEIPGQATADGSPAGLWTPTSGANQRWALRDETVTSTDPVRTYTLPGRVPALPATVTATPGRVLPVTWTMPSAKAWRKPGTVTVRGTATDVLGRAIVATAEVTVDTFRATAPARAKAYQGGVPALPATVTGLGDHGGRAELPVTWGPVPPLTTIGVTEARGTARLADGRTVPATVRIQVTAPVPAAVTGVSVAASFTEGGYSTAGLTNGVTTDKAWSNWRSTGRTPSETLTATLPSARDVTGVVVHHYRDSASGGGVARSVRAGVPGPDGTCTGGPEVAVDGATTTVPLPGGPADTICVVLTTAPNGYLTVAELEVLAKAPGVSADAALTALSVDGVPVRGFDPDRDSYRVDVRKPEKAVITTVADPYASVAVRAEGRNRVITVTGEDGTQTRTYRLMLV